MSGLFDTLNISKSGLFTQQTAINVTSHNISNANTDGYSRQRAVMETNEPFYMPSMDNASGAGQIGMGVHVSVIQRVRDIFTDYQIRQQTAIKGQYTARDNFLGQIENVLNEPSDTGLSKQIQSFFSAWQDLSKQPQSSNERTTVVQQASALADQLNSDYSQLQNIKTNTQSTIQGAVYEVNTMLSQIDQLNRQIVTIKSGGQQPNDLEDSRDLLIDKLSSKFGITIDSKDLDGEDITPQVETDTSNPADTSNWSKNLPANPKIVSVSDPDSSRHFSYISSIVQDTSDASGTTYKITYYKNGDMTSDSNKVTMTVTGIDADKFKQIDQTRVLWADNKGISIAGDGTENPTDGTSSIDCSKLKLFTTPTGELKGYASVQQDIDNYTYKLNKMAKALAFSVNAVESGLTSSGTAAGSPSSPPEADYMPFFVNSSAAVYKTSSSGKQVLFDPGDSSTLSNLNTVLDNEKNITAGNISINKQIFDNPMEIKTRTNDDQFAYESLNDKDGEKDGARALAIAQLSSVLMDVQDMSSSYTREDWFNKIGALTAQETGGVKTVKSDANGTTLSTYFTDTVDVLGSAEQEAKKKVTNQTTLLSSLEQQKNSNSGVSLDEEVANLVQFQHAYQANAKIISTVDELLDVVINGLKRS